MGCGTSAQNNSDEGQRNHSDHRQIDSADVGKTKMWPKRAVNEESNPYSETRESGVGEMRNNVNTNTQVDENKSKNSNAVTCPKKRGTSIEKVNFDFESVYDLLLDPEEESPDMNPMQKNSPDKERNSGVQDKNGCDMNQRNNTDICLSQIPNGVDDDDFDVVSTTGSHKDDNFIGGQDVRQDVGQLAIFYNKPQECYFCHSADVVFFCENCDDLYLCVDCMANKDLKGVHDRLHVISAMRELKGDVSRTFGGESSVGTFDGASNSFFFDPCIICSRIILDSERVFHCDECNVVVCENCYQQNHDVHEHPTRPFQRSNRSTLVTESTIVSKSRNSDGNKVINDYVVVKLLGKGSFAKVKLVQHRRTHMLYALKILRRHYAGGGKRYLAQRPSADNLLREIAVMKIVVHPNIVQLKEIIDDVEAQKVYIIMEYCEGGPVHILGKSPLPIEVVRKYGRDIAVGLLHLHAEYLFHRDVKPANCLITSSDVVKIADFGSCSSRLRSVNVDGTPAFNCPEQLNDSKVSGEVVDSWGFAMTLYQMAFGKLPINTNSLAELRQSLSSPEPFVIPPCENTELHDLLTMMLDKDLSKRLLLSRAVLHPFLDIHETTQALITESLSMSVSQSDLFDLGMQAVRCGKRINECFHGVQELRRMNRRSSRINSHNQDDCNDDLDLHLLDQLNDGKDGAAASQMNSQPPSSARRTVSMRLEDGCKGHLEYSHVELKVTPSDIYESAPLTTSILLSDNGFTRLIPIDFTLFTGLREISIVQNALKEFPVEVLRAPRLRRLDLSFNRITNIPEELMEARLLESLLIHDNSIVHVGVDKHGHSVFSGSCLRNVRISGNPLDHLPEALHTCPKLELLMDASPVLLEEWGEIILEVAERVLVVWNDIYPRPLDENIPIYIASKNVKLYRAYILKSLHIRHVVIPQIETNLCAGRMSSGEVERHMRMAALENFPDDGKNLNPQEPSSRLTGNGEMQTSCSPGGKITLSLFRREARNSLKSYFLVSSSEEDAKGGYRPLVDFMVNCCRSEERVLVVLEDKRTAKVVREIVIAALCQAMRHLTGNRDFSVNACYAMVTEATRSMYN